MSSHLANVPQQARRLPTELDRTQQASLRWCTALPRSPASQGRRRATFKVTQLVYGNAGIYLGVSGSRGKKTGPFYQEPQQVGSDW